MAVMFKSPSALWCRVVLWQQHGPLKCGYPAATLCSVTTQKTLTCRVTYLNICLFQLSINTLWNEIMFKIVKEIGELQGFYGVR